ncbi:sugar transferase [Sphingomonas sp. T9W2]|uniref:sugar transferase n=1 Tax=Sphingomonas sp. T9W2 TaxID=3143183 RepID=UPI0031F48D2F
MMKRLVDVLVSAILLIVTAPLMLVAAIAVRRSSPGPVIFRQQRVGRGGKSFNILKFRTMDPATATDREITVGNDRRITPIGAVLRKWKIDELPQLINVLRGDMSLVGPRPDVPSYVARYPKDLRAKVLSVRPGITDLASIKYRNENELLAAQSDPDRYYLEIIMLDKLRMGASYAERPSFGRDLRIIVATVRSVLMDR